MLVLLVRHSNRMHQPNYCSYSTVISIRIEQEHKKVGSELQISTNATAHMSRGSDLGNRRHTGIRRNYYTQASFNKLHAQIVHTFFKKNTVMKDANLEARMAGRPIPFRTDRFTALKMLQRPVLLTHDGQCRVGVLVYLYHRLKTPKASRYSVYDKVKRGGCQR